MRIVLPAASLVVTVAVFACALDEVTAPKDYGPTAPSLQVIPPVVGQDSLGFVFSWPPVIPRADQHPVHGYNTELYDAPTTTLVDAGFVSGTNVDTLYGAMPPLGEAQSVYACVQTVDTTGATSPFTCSRAMSFTLVPAGPNAPDSVVVDTLPTLPLPSAQVVDVVVYPQNRSVSVGDTVQFCAFLQYSDSSWDAGGPFSSFTHQTYCASKLDQYLAGGLV